MAEDNMLKLALLGGAGYLLWRYLEPSAIPAGNAGAGRGASTGPGTSTGQGASTRVPPAGGAPPGPLHTAPPAETSKSAGLTSTNQQIAAQVGGETELLPLLQAAAYQPMAHIVMGYAANVDTWNWYRQAYAEGHGVSPKATPAPEDLLPAGTDRGVWITATQYHQYLAGQGLEGLGIGRGWLA